jgi:hypothetical protein
MSPPTPTTSWGCIWASSLRGPSAHRGHDRIYFRGDAEAVLAPQDEAKFETVTYTYYEQLNGYEHLKKLDIGYFFYSAPMWTTS